jgi:hypothetical protein
MHNMIDVRSQLVAAGCLPLITTAITVVFQVAQTNIDTVAFVGNVQVIYEDIAPWIPESSFDCLLTVLNQALTGSGFQPFSRLHISLELFAFEMLVSYSRFSFVELDTSPVAPPVVRDDPCTLEIKVGFVLLVG